MPPAYEVLLLNTAVPQIQAAQAGDTYVCPRDIQITANLEVTGNTILGDASTDTVRVNGYMGVGGAPSSVASVFARGTALTGTNQYGVYAAPTGTSSAITSVNGVTTAPATADAAFTATSVYGLRALNATKGAASTITSLHGIRVDDQTVGTNNYGITSLVSSGTDKWNIYASGTAANYFAGNVGIGTVAGTAPAYRLQIIGASASPTVSIEGNPVVTGTSYPGILQLRNNAVTIPANDSIGEIQFYSSDASGSGAGVTSFIKGIQDAASPNLGALVFGTGSSASTERLRIDSSGNVGIGTSTPTYKTTIVESNTGAASTLLAVHNSGIDAGTEARIVLAGGNGLSTRHAYIGAINSGAGAGNAHSLVFATNANSAAPLERLRLTPTEAVFNDLGNDYDFRVESDTNTHALFVDGATGYIGLNESNPATHLVLRGLDTGSYTSALTTNALMDGGAPSSFLYIYNDADTDGAYCGIAFNTTRTGGNGNTSYIANIATSTNSTGSLAIGRRIGSTASGEWVNFGPTEVVFNDAGYDNDFRVESDTSTHALFVQGSDGFVGIGTSTPSTKLNIVGGDVLIGTDSGSAFNGDAFLRIQNSLNAYIGIKAGTAASAGILFGDTDDSFVGGMQYSNTDNALFFNAGNAERLRIDSSGNLIQTVNTTAATLTTNQTLTFSIVDNSTLRISVRGSDGTTRTATVALT